MRVSRFVPCTAILAAAVASGCDSRTGPSSLGDARGPDGEAALPPTVIFREIAAFPGSFPWREPWSPHGSALVYNDGVLRAFDAANPGRGSTALTTGYVFYLDWSPDGRWLLGKHTVDPRTGLDRLLAIPLSGAGEIEMYRAVREMGHVLWGSNGYLYHLNRALDALVRRDPPPAWREQNPEPFPLRNQYLPVTGDQVSLTVGRVRTYPTHEELVPLVPAVDAHVVLLMDDFPDGLAILAAVLPRAAPYYYIVADENGREQRRYPASYEPTGDGRFRSSAPHSVSADGRTVAGADAIDDGHSYYEAHLWLTSLDGSWIAPIEGTVDSLEPHLSRDGLLLAYGGLHDGLIHVGELEIRWESVRE